MSDLTNAKDALSYRRVCVFDRYVRNSQCQVHHCDTARPGDAFCEEVPYLEWFGFDALAKLVEALEKGDHALPTTLAEQLRAVVRPSVCGDGYDAKERTEEIVEGVLQLLKLLEKGDNNE